ncbi:MAG: hypothetical protein ABIP79_15555 [Chitinophagaceae bacterium]
MKKTTLSLILFVLAANAFAQQQTFDLVTFTAPKNWVKEVKAGTFTSFTVNNKQKNVYCRIFILASTSSKGGIKEDFDSEWQNLVSSQYNLTTAAQLSETAPKDGWETKSGLAPFTYSGGQSAVMLYTMSGYNKAASILALTNSGDYNHIIAQFLASVKMKKPATLINKAPAIPVTNNKFTFTSTNFDDGWTATEQADWVEVIKGNSKVLIHYPNKKADAYNSVVMDGLKNAWDILVSPRYSSASNMEFKPITGWQTIEFAEADMLEKITGKSVHVVFFKMNYSNGSGKYLEFITPNKQSFEKEFGPYHPTTSGWEKMENMAFRNKFAVAASDLQGKWSNDFSGAIQYVNAYTGFDAGMDTHASVENFKIVSGNTYTWDISVASGAVGNIKFQSKKSSGGFTMLGNWKINFSDIEGKAAVYDVYFSCIKGLRILWLNNRPFAKAE